MTFKFPSFKEVKEAYNNHFMNIQSFPSFGLETTEIILEELICKSKSLDDFVQKNPFDLGGKTKIISKYFFDKNKIEVFLEDLSQTKEITGYQLSIPSKLSQGRHGVAFVFNPIKKRIIYHDSYSEKMPKILKEPLEITFPEFQITSIKKQNQFREKKMKVAQFFLK